MFGPISMLKLTFHFLTSILTRIVGGGLASVAANQSTDLTMDFRVGFLLRTPPDQQWYAQGLGTLVAAFLAPKLFQLFMDA